VDASVKATADTVKRIFCFIILPWFLSRLFRLWHIIQRCPDRDEGFAFQALFKLTWQFLGMCDHPGVSVGMVVRFASLEIDIKVDKVRSREP
jgi:hypothetical protein